MPLLQLRTSSAPASDGRLDLVSLEAIDRHSATFFAKQAGNFPGPRPALTRNAAEVDHVGSVLFHLAGEPDDLRVGQTRRVIDFGKDFDLIPTQIGCRRWSAEIVRQIVQVLWPSLEGDVETVGQNCEFALAPAGQNHAVGPLGQRELAGHPFDLHQGCHADWQHGDVEIEANLGAQSFNDLPQRILGQFARDEDDRFPRRRSAAALARTTRARLAQFSAPSFWGIPPAAIPHPVSTKRPLRSYVPEPRRAE